MAREILDVTDQVMCDEAQALAELLAAPGRVCMVHVILAYDGDEGETRHGHGVAGRTTGAHLRQFIIAAERQLTWLRDKLYGWATS